LIVSWLVVLKAKIAAVRYRKKRGLCLTAAATTIFGEAFHLNEDKDVAEIGKGFFGAVGCSTLLSFSSGYRSKPSFLRAFHSIPQPLGDGGTTNYS
jgi:hypothetical protein